MKKLICLFAIVVFSSNPLTTFAQPHGGRSGPPEPEFSAAMKKLFSDNPDFTANIEIQMKGDSGEMTMPGKMAYAGGKSRMEMDMSQMKGGMMRPEDIKQMGMDKTVMISLPEKKLSYRIYPGLESYLEAADKDPDAAKPASEFETKVTELGKETVDGHDCVKSKIEVTNQEGKKREFTVWTASDLKKFPLKIETHDKEHMVLSFKDVKFDKPAASEFEVPAAYTKHDSFMGMMQQSMMKRMGNLQAPR